MTLESKEAEEGGILEFSPPDLEKLTGAQGGYKLEMLDGNSLFELIERGLIIEINDDELRAELLGVGSERAHKSRVAYARNPDRLTLVDDSLNHPLNQQDRIVASAVKKEIERLDLGAVSGGISRLADWATIILKHYQRTKAALFNTDGPYIVTRTGVLEDKLKGVEDSVAIFKQVGPNKIAIATQTRDEGAYDVVAAPLLFPKAGIQTM